jgi:hypothetical protein
MHLERRDERGGIGEYSEVVEYPRDMVVHEHGELPNVVREEGGSVSVDREKAAAQVPVIMSSARFQKKTVQMGV